jgi:hypothetical protein
MASTPASVPGGWVAPDERPPMRPGCVATARRRHTPSTQPSQGLALASMIIGILGLVAGGCLGPIPGIVALVWD